MLLQCEQELTRAFSPPYFSREIIARIGDLALMRHLGPIALENVLHAQLKQLFIREHIAARSENSVLGLGPVAV